MATTSGTLAAGKAALGQGGNGKGSKGRAGVLVATAALGLSLVVGGILGQGRQAERAAPQAKPAAGDTHVAGAWDFREDHRADAALAFAADPFTYREDRRSGLVAVFVPDPFTYREDRRGEALAAPPASDPFLYREDHRTQVVPSVVAPVTTDRTGPADEYTR